ncbi:MAG: efflux RND transporter periplasmic adaptor subunit [Deltaproteobacteria bacterium]|nr:efflux RND transporter periplasmic adaptor subunit [Deltaproteobacteria bacterium]
MRTAALAAGLSLFAFVAACKKPDPSKTDLTSAEGAAPPVKVTTAAVVEQLMPELLVLTGSLRASQESDVAADASGKVTATFVERGQRVKQGETLAILDARGANITATAAAAQSGFARAQLEQAQRECDRVKTLFESGAISKAEFDRTTSQCQTTQFSLAAAQAQQQNAQKIVGDSVIRAPFTGFVGERFVNVGQYVQPSTKVVSLYNPDPLRLELTVPEATVGAMKPDLPITFTVSSFGDEKFGGAIKYIAPNVRPATRDLIVEALCPNAEGKLKPGMFAVATLLAGEKKVAAVPTTSIKKDEATARVFVVAEKRIQERLVQLGGEKEGSIAVLAGVKPGEAVVVNPGPDVRDGAPVAN